MVCIIKNRDKFYKKTLLDIWGYHRRYKKISKLIYFMKIIRDHRRARRLLYRREFIFNFKKRIWFKFRKRFKKEYIKHRFLFNFYLIVKKKNFLKYKKLASKLKGFYTKNYFNFVEGRLFMLVYRANFINNLFKLKSIIDRGIFYVNGQRKFFSNYHVKVGELVQVDFKYKKLLSIDMKYRFMQRVIIRNPGRYLYINYKFLFILFLRSPKLNELKFPIRIDIKKGGDIYFL
jgi:ribosomal protein S4